MSQPATVAGIAVEGGEIPTVVVGPRDTSRLPALVVVPSIFGPAPDLIARLSRFAGTGLVAVPDPFWRAGGGVLPYDDIERARGRLAGFDLGRCVADLGAVVEWARANSNGRLAGLGICFGGPFVLHLAGEGRLDGVVTWHGSRMERFLQRAADVRCPLRLHFGADDPVTPPEVIEAIRAAFAHHPDVSIVVHPGAVHGFSHDGDAYDAVACEAGLAAVGELLASLA
jgi:carboxymethylenebutenolidase